MPLNFEYQSTGNIETDAVMIYIASDDLQNFAIKQYLPAKIYDSIELGIKNELFVGNYNEQKTFPVSSVKPKLVHLCGLGELKDLTPEKLRRISAKAIRNVMDTKFESKNPSKFDQR